MTNSPASRRRWRPTVGHWRSIVAALTLIVVAVLWRRPDLLVIATPFAAIAAWSIVDRPTEVPTFDARVGPETIREGDAATWRVTWSDLDHTDLVIAELGAAPWVDRRPANGAVTAIGTAGSTDLTIGVRSTRWGRREIPSGRLLAASPWGAFAWAAKTDVHSVRTLPQPAVFDPDPTARPTDGLVGQYRSVRAGEGSEFAGLRAFQVGDRMRRINWPRTLRAPGLLVNATWADQDTHVDLVVDAGDDIGRSDGVDGAASSLDATVRAAGAIAEHYTRRGDRVSLTTFGTRNPHDVAAGTGHTHLRRMLDTLAALKPGGVRTSERPGPRGGHHATGDSRMTVMLSPLVSPVALERAVAIGRRGVAVVVVDTLPDEVVEDDDRALALAWRLRLLERRRELRHVRAAGIPVVTWQGPGSLDQFLRDVARRASAPRVSPR